MNRFVVAAALLFATSAARADKLVLVAGGGNGPDGSPAASAKLVQPFGVDFGSDGTAYIVEMAKGERLRAINAKGELVTLAGTAGQKGYSGDGGPALQATFNGMHSLGVGPDGNVYLADTWNNCVRVFDTKAGTVNLFAGKPVPLKEGVRQPPPNEELGGVYSICWDPAGTALYICDLDRKKILKADRRTRALTVVAGNGQRGVPKDGEDAATQPLIDPRAVAVDAKGNVYVLERGGHALRVVDAKGKIRTLAGTGKAGLGTGKALEAAMNGPKHLCIDKDGSVLIADTENHRIVRYVPGAETIVRVAGTGKRGTAGVDGDPRKAEFNQPHGVTVHPKTGEVYISDASNGRVLKIVKEDRRDEPGGSPGGKPNVVIILADDLGYGDLGCYNKASKIPTPNLDRLAAQGIRFTDAHSPSSVCTPTRYSLLTGRYAWRTKLQRGVLGPWGPPLIAADRLTVASFLRQHGYATGCVGKWHLGWTWPTKDGKPPASGDDRLSNVDFTRPIADGPTTRGFDYYFGTDIPNYPPYCFVGNNRTVGIPSLPDTGRIDGFNRPGPMLPGWKLVDILPALTTKAAKWVEDAAKGGKPFFLYVPLTSPHYPVVPAPEFKGKSGAGDFGDFVVQTDWTVGEVLQALDRARVADNTLVLFTSDNGPEITGEVNPGVYDRAQRFRHFSMGELRGAKRDAWEGGHRVPFLARWPGKIKPGTTSDETICHVDCLRTVAALLGAELPANAAEDSVSILPALLGEKREGPLREATVHHAASGKFAIRKGDWVLIDDATGDDNGKRGEPEWLKKERGYSPHNHPGELFDVRHDLSQRRNLWAEQPERVKELKGLLEKYKRDGRSTPGAPQKNDVPVK